jgi:hypothetical protein
MLNPIVLLLFFFFLSNIEFLSKHLTML